MNPGSSSSIEWIRATIRIQEFRCHGFLRKLTFSQILRLLACSKRCKYANSSWNSKWTIRQPIQCIQTMTSQFTRRPELKALTKLRLSQWQFYSRLRSGNQKVTSIKKFNRLRRISKAIQSLGPNTPKCSNSNIKPSEARSLAILHTREPLVPPI